MKHTDSRPNLLIVGGGILQMPAIARAKETGLKVMVMDRNPDAPGMKVCDIPLAVDFSDRKKVSQILKKLPPSLQGVMTISSDIPVDAVARIAEFFGLPAISPDTAALNNNKILMRRRLQENAVPIPEFKAVKSSKEAETAARKIGFPIMIKAIDSSGSRGITKVENLNAVVAAFNRALKYSKSPEVCVEKFLEGMEIGAQAVMEKGQMKLFLLHNDTLTKPPYYVPVGHSFPSRLPITLIKKIRTICEIALRSLEMTHCMANIDLTLVNNQPYILEIGARLGGTCLPQLVKYHTGIDIIEENINMALGRKIDLKPRHAIPVAAILLEAPAKGRIQSIDYPANLFNDPRILEFQIDVQRGDEVEPFTCGPNRIGHIIVCEKSARAAEALTLSLKKKIQFHVT